MTVIFYFGDSKKKFVTPGTVQRCHNQGTNIKKQFPAHYRFRNGREENNFLIYCHGVFPLDLPGRKEVAKQQTTGSFSAVE